MENFNYQSGENILKNTHMAALQLSVMANLVFSTPAPTPLSLSHDFKASRRPRIVPFVWGGYDLRWWSGKVRAVVKGGLLPRGSVK